MKKVGYVLSGGGARGFAHLGVIKYLEELSIRPSAISGTSAGSIVGALYAAGKSAEEILNLTKTGNFFGWDSFAWRQKGIFKMDMLRNLLREIVPGDNFSALKIPFYATATDLNSGSELTFSNGVLSDAVVASCSIPVIFDSVTLGERILVDGGLMNNFPVEPLIDTCDIIIGSYVNKIEEGIGNNSSMEIVNYLDRCFHLAISRTVYAKISHCHVFIESPLHSYNMYNIKAAGEIFEIGYNTAKKSKDKLEKLLTALN